MVTERKYPTTTDKHIGIEVEFLSPLAKAKIIEILEQSKLKNYYHLHTDSSITMDKPPAFYCPLCGGLSHLIQRGNVQFFSCDHVYADAPPKGVLLGHELSLVIKQKNLKSSLFLLRKDLKDIEASVNSTCGLHIHLDMRSRNVNQCFIDLIKSQKLLFSLVDKKRKGSEFCAEVPEDMADVDDGDHHDAINGEAYGKHRTIEVRMHHGTLDMWAMYKWTKLLISIVDRKKPSFYIQNYIRSAA